MKHKLKCVGLVASSASPAARANAGLDTYTFKSCKLRIFEGAQIVGFRPSADPADVRGQQSREQGRPSAGATENWNAAAGQHDTRPVWRGDHTGTFFKEKQQHGSSKST